MITLATFAAASAAKVAAGTDSITAWATVVLAIVGALAFIANAALAFLTFLSVRTARDAVTLQREELGLLRRSIEVAEGQYEDAQEATFPQLTMRTVDVGDRLCNVELSYVLGTQQALDVRVWVRTGTRIRAIRIERMGPADRAMTFIVPPATDADLEALPWPDFVDADLPTGQVWEAMQWRNGAGRQDGFRRRMARTT